MYTGVSTIILCDTFSFYRSIFSYLVLFIIRSRFPIHVSAFSFENGCSAESIHTSICVHFTNACLYVYYIICRCTVYTRIIAYIYLNLLVTINVYGLKWIRRYDQSVHFTRTTFNWFLSPLLSYSLLFTLLSYVNNILNTIMPILYIGSVLFNGYRAERGAYTRTLHRAPHTCTTQLPLRYIIWLLRVYGGL